MLSCLISTRRSFGPAGYWERFRKAPTGCIDGELGGCSIATLRFVEDIPLSPEHPSWPALLEVERGLARLAEKPVCLIWGEKDWCFTPDYRRGFEQRLPQARVHKAENAGHSVIEDAREDVLRWMAVFLRDHPQAP